MDLDRSCPVCGKQNVQSLFKPKKSPGMVSQCMHCGMVYVSKVENDQALIFEGPIMSCQTSSEVLTSSNLADVSNSWEFDLLPDKVEEWPILQQNAMDTITRLEFYVHNSSSECKILDFGSGWGFFLAVAKEHGWSAYGLEPLPASSIYARATFGLNITTDTLHENTFPLNFFDVITAFQVFEHLPYLSKDIGYLHKILKSGGIILVEVPNFDTWTMGIMKSRHRHFVQDHINFFSTKTLGKLLTENGFVIVDSYCTARRMSIRHLTKFWLHRYLPPPMFDVIQNSLQRTSLWEKSININIGDIITVIARKV